MPFVTNRDVRIHYETIGNGPALVMHHGTFGSGADFIDLGYVDALKADHQVILLIQERPMAKVDEVCAAAEKTRDPSARAGPFPIVS